ncbi:amidohydrolase [Thermocrispum municipale]|uniref:amidohydrolase n=1 Tax=Thermocrispum municipale TaxID=37926 RepID=UPI000403DEE5|nr:amidohydrolase [Thermocrispum municipale]
MRVDVVYTGARVLSGADFRPVDAVAVHGGRVVALGAEAVEIEANKRIDLSGAVVVPGFHDAHNHMAWYGMEKTALDLSERTCRRVDDVYAAVAEAAGKQPPGSWIIGSGYDQNKLVGGHPTAEGLDRVAGEHLVRLGHTSGHMCVVNSAVLRQLDLDHVPTGGDVVRDESGRPTGLLREQAQRLLDPLRYPVPLDDIARGIALASKQYLSEGITSVQEAGIGRGLVGNSPIELAAYQQAREAGQLGVRTTLMVAAQSLHALQHAQADDVSFGLDLGIRTGFGDDWLRIGPMKLFSDGSLVGRTCAMHEPFDGEPDNRGYFQMPEEDIADTIRAAHRSGWQIATHAIGDRAVSVVLDAYAAALADFPRRDHRHRIEHCGVIDDAELARLAEMDIIPVPQGRFVNEIGDGMRAALGPSRVDRCYRQRSFLDAGCVVPGSSDRPVVEGAPLLGIADLVRRRTSSGFLLGADERISATEALRAYTFGSAYASFTERDRGTIDVGKLADFAVLSHDPTDPESLDEVRVLATVVGGDMVYERSGDAGT